MAPGAAASPPALSVEVASVAPGAEDFLVAAVEALAEAEAVSAEAADKNFSSMKRSLACILSPYLKKGGCFV